MTIYVKRTRSRIVVWIAHEDGTREACNIHAVTGDPSMFRVEPNGIRESQWWKQPALRD